MKYNIRSCKYCKMCPASCEHKKEISQKVGGLKMEGAATINCAHYEPYAEVGEYAYFTQFTKTGESFKLKVSSLSKSGKHIRAYIFRVSDEFMDEYQEHFVYDFEGRSEPHYYYYRDSYDDIWHVVVRYNYMEQERNDVDYIVDSNEPGPMVWPHPESEITFP